MLIGLYRSIVSSSNEAECPITTYELVMNPVFSNIGRVTSYTSNTNSQLSIDSSGNISLLTTASFAWETYYIRVSIRTSQVTNKAENAAYIPLKLRVINCLE